jgi:hypothetical protein
MGGVDVKIIYGFCLQTYADFQTVLTAKQIKKLYQKNRKFCNHSEPETSADDEEDFPYCMAVEKIVKIYDVIEEDIVAESVDFENESEIGVDGECALVGICINSGGGHYSGVLKMPTISEAAQETLDAFVTKYPQFSGFERQSYIYYRNDK